MIGGVKMTVSFVLGIFKFSSKVLLLMLWAMWMAIALFSGRAHAQEAVYRCVFEGKTVYTDRPCPSGAVGTVVVSPLTATSIPVCSGSVEPLLQYLNNERFMVELRKICPGAKIDDKGRVIVLVEGRRVEIMVGGGMERATQDQEKIFDQYQAFEFDGFIWRVLSVKKFLEVGRAGYSQKPKNGVFVVVEFELKNASSRPRYHGSGIILVRDTQYPESSKVVYAEEQMGYRSNSTTQFMAGSRLKSYMMFDTEFSSEYTLVLRAFGGGKMVKIRLQ